MFRIDFQENVRMAITAVLANKLRSILTLIGIIAGVASIIAVMTGIRVIQTKMERELTVLGSDVFQVQKWPAVGGPGKNWRKIMRRPPLTIEHADILRDRVTGADLVGPQLWEQPVMIRHGALKTSPNIAIFGGTPEFQINNNQMVDRGRFLGEEDVRIGRPVIVIGVRIAAKLFPFSDPIDQPVEINGQKYTVIGIFEEAGDASGGSADNQACIPITTFVRHYGLKDKQGINRSVAITVKANAGVRVEDVMEEVRSVLRVARHLRYQDEDDFDIFSNDSLIRAFDDMTSIIKLVAVAMGAIALLVAGIGIMNIMLVSVTERTKEIGIRKSVGAKRRDILIQFLVEAVLLCQLGGLVGILVGMALGNIVSLVVEVPVEIPWDWAIAGMVFCSVIGIAFGLWPASKASKMDPIESLRYE